LKVKRRIKLKISKVSSQARLRKAAVGRSMDHATRVDAAVRRERLAFAAKVRAARAVLGLSQAKLANRVGMTQKSIYRIELGADDLRRSTVIAVEQVLKAEGIEFEELPGGGFKVVVPDVILSNLERNI
jgi:DNA-binding XRE family transcriptional regulator